MKYMIDLHGVIDSNPKYFRKMIDDLIKNGNSVYICTGSKYINAIDTLTDLGFGNKLPFLQILSISTDLEYSLPAAEIEYDVNGNLWVDDMLWWPMKGKFCKKYKIDVIIDDSEEYFVYVPENVVKLHYHQNSK